MIAVDPNERAVSGKLIVIRPEGKIVGAQINILDVERQAAAEIISDARAPLIGERRVAVAVFIFNKRAAHAAADERREP